MNNYWKATPKEAVKIQNRLKDKVKIKPFKKKIIYIGGADVSFNKFDTFVFAGIIILKLPDFKIVDYKVVKTEVSFPYIPGLLSFREIPALLKAWEKLKTRPDVLIVDGQGIAHPRGMGIASHFGLVTNTPTIGCAKSPLKVTFKMPKNRAGSNTNMFYQGKKVGTVYKSKKNSNPLFISPGYLTDFDDSLKIVKSCLLKHKLPEPTRLAHILTNKKKTW